MNSRKKSVIERYVDMVIRYRIAVIAITFGVVLFLAFGALRLTFSSDYQVFFGENNPELADFEKTQKLFSRSDNILIMLAPDNKEVFSKDTLQAVLDFTESAWTLPYVTRVDSISNFQRSYANGDELIIESMYDEVPDTFDVLKMNSLSEPLLAGRLISRNAEVTGINVTFNTPGDNPLSETPEVVRATRDLVEKLQNEYPEIKFYETGVVLFNYTLAEATIIDMTTLVPLVYVLVAVGTAVFLRSVLLSVATVILVTLSICAAMGLAGWAGVVLTPPSASVPPIIMTLAVADCLHIMALFQQKRIAGLSVNQSVVESMKLNLKPVFLTSVSTAIGFMTLNFSDAPPFRDLGNITAIGVIVAFILSVTFLPALLSLLPFKSVPESEKIAPRMRQLAEFVLARSRVLLVVGGLIVVTCAVLVPRNELNDNFVEYIGETYEFRTDTDTMTDKLIGLYTIEYVLESGESYGVANPEFLKKVDQFSSWLSAQDSVAHVDSIAEIVKRLHKNLHNDDPAFYEIPADQSQISQYFLLYEMSLPNGLDLNNQLNVDKSSTRIMVSLETMSTSGMLEFEDRATAWLENNAPDIRGAGVSPSVMFSHISVRNINSMLLGTSIALVLISVFLVLPLRSARHGLLSIVSNVGPAIVAFGIWALLVGKVSLGVSVVIAMTLGIVVDDTIHFLNKYLHARRVLDLDTPEAIRYSFSTVGVALVGTTIILTAGFLVMGMSSYQVNSHMGILSATTVSVALLIDLFLLPPLLLLVDRNKSVRPRIGA